MIDEIETMQDRKVLARQSPAGKNLTVGQLNEGVAICEILHARIHKSGVFTDKLSHQAYGFARTEGVDVPRAEQMFRGLYTAVYGETMNQTRERLMEREKEIHDIIGNVALRHAHSVIDFIRDGETMPFYRALDKAAIAMANENGITQIGAKTMMKDAFRSHEGRELYEAGKEAEALYHKPAQEEANRSERKPFSRKRLQVRD